jgi:hypothetical protein
MIGAKTVTPIWKNTDFLMCFKPLRLYSKAKIKSWVGRRRWGGRNKNKRKEKEEQWWEGRKEGRRIWSKVQTKFEISIFLISILSSGW